MNILHCVHSSNPEGGGVWEAVSQFARAHRIIGNDVHIVTLDKPSAPWCTQCDDFLTALGPSNRFGFCSKFSKWLKSKAHEFDCVLVHGLWQFHGYAVMKVLTDIGLPYFVFPHGMLDPWFKTAYPLKHLKKSIYWRIIENKVISKARGVLFTCFEESRLAQHTFKPFKCTPLIAPLGIDFEEGNSLQQINAFNDSYPSLDRASFLIYLSRIHPKKGLDLILESFLNISQPIPNLVVAGPIDDAGYKLHLDGLIEKIVVKHPDWQCIWTGMLTGDKKWGALRSADAFILPSHQENFGIAVIESLAVGTPVLISNKVNIYTEIIDSDAGLVSDDTVNGVTKLLNDWIQSGDRTKDKCSDNAKKCFYNNFEITSAAKNLETLLSEAIAFNSN